ncbi:uncharacterized protein LOC130219042, partial [Danio aesculapii]|uniref:uncharacterized protein LOC130219042 n=1 Tax=Danio aesculapii TaxID=1142201 RepID=UPI0024BFE21E
MRSLMFLLVLVLFCSLQDTSSGSFAVMSANSVCCIGNFTEIKVPVKQILSYQWTTSDCLTKAIVFTTKGEKKICVDPESTFVKRQLAKMDNRAKERRSELILDTSALRSSSSTKHLLIPSPEISRRMRSLMFLSVLALFCFVQETLSSPEASNLAHSVCCEGFTDIKIPVKRIVSYHWTSSNCPLKAIVFKTTAGRDICVNPDNTLVRSHVAKLDKRTPSATTSSPESTSAKSAPESTSVSKSAPESTSAKSAPE